MIQHRSSFLGPVAAAVFAAIVAAAAPVYAETELEACQRLATKYDAQAEVVLWDKSRVDLLSDTHAIEVDWAKKHYEAVGQATWYAMVTGRRPAVLLLVRRWEDWRHVLRCFAICYRLGIRVYIEPSWDREGRSP